MKGETQPIISARNRSTPRPYGNHAFFRIGSDRAGSPTISLQPSDFVPGVTRTTCIRGEKGRNYSSNVHASGTCFLSSVGHSCLKRAYAAYPTGPELQYLRRTRCPTGGETREPADAVPGWGDNPPPAGTYAPNRYVTLVGCSTIFCREGEGGELEPYLPRDFRTRLPGRRRLHGRTWHCLAGTWADSLMSARPAAPRPAPGGPACARMNW
jgi:hypothetical protein